MSYFSFKTIWCLSMALPFFTELFLNSEIWSLFTQLQFYHSSIIYTLVLSPLLSVLLDIKLLPQTSLSTLTSFPSSLNRKLPFFRVLSYWLNWLQIALATLIFFLTLDSVVYINNVNNVSCKYIAVVLFGFLWLFSSTAIIIAFIWFKINIYYTWTSV